MSNKTQQSAAPVIEGERGASLLTKGGARDSTAATLKKGAFVGSIILISGFVIYNSSPKTGDKDDRGGRTVVRAMAAFDPAPTQAPSGTSGPACRTPRCSGSSTRGFHVGSGSR